MSATALLAAESGTSDRPCPAAVFDPRARIVAILTFAVAVVATKGLLPLGAAFLLALAAAATANLGARRIARRMIALEGFMIVLLATLPFTVPGDNLFAVGPFSASLDGMELAAAIALKANAVMLMLLALTGGMDAVNLGHALGRLGVPQKLVVLLLFTVRYIAVFEDEYRRLRRAMRARAFRLTSSRHSWRSLGWLMGMLLVRSNDRATRVLQAMRCRGFTGRFHVIDRLQARPRDAAFVIAAMAVSTLIVAWDRLA